MIETVNGLEDESSFMNRMGGNGLLKMALAALFIFSALTLSACSSGDDENVGGANKNAQTATPLASPTGVKVAVKAATASNTGTGNVATANATDGDIKTHWSAGGPPPQWIQLELAEETSITKVRFAVSQSPAGPTTHQIYGGPTPDQLKVIGTWDGMTQDSQWVEVSTPATNVRYVKIATVKSPSWVAWREIEVYK